MNNFLELLEMIGVGCLAIVTAFISALIIIVMIGGYMLAISSPIILIAWLITRA